MRKGLSMAALLAAAFGLAACDTLLGESDGPPLPGERISVLRLNRTLVPDPALSDLRVRLPEPYANTEWPQPGGYSTHAMQHLAAAESLNKAWSSSVGQGSGDDRFILAQPVVAGGRIYAMDAGDAVTAFDAQGGGQAWRVDLTPGDEDDGLFGGGLALDDGHLFVTTPYGEVASLDAGSGKILWRVKVDGPLRSAPAASGGRLFVVTTDNQLFALAQDDGRQLWTYTGITQDAGLLGGSTPAVAGGVVVAAFSSGELVAFGVDSGRTLWSDSLAGTARGDAVATLADIRGLPVIDRGRVIAVSNSGTLTAIDLERGGRLWNTSIGSSQTPWVAGDFIYILSSTDELICLTRDEGRARWIESLPQFQNEKDREDPIAWAGPVLVGDRLVVTSSAGDALSMSPYTGEALGRIQLPSSAHLPPVVANSTMYLLSDNGELTAFR
ncbi:MAG TPA: PQQ-binding-like beta-propeller repeat protein [Candidatus Angelobacter sp.]|nr:PQQ-binding-like beta-propeller repeat protein [Candidatus Angelobacter sp.]